MNSNPTLEFTTRLFKTAKVGEVPIECRMASSHPLAQDPIDSIDGLRTAYDIIVGLYSSGEDDKAETLAKLYLQNFVE